MLVNKWSDDTPRISTIDVLEIISRYDEVPVGAKIRNRNAASGHLAPQGVVGDAQLRLQCGLSPTGDLALAWFGFVLGSYTGSNAPNLVAAPRAPK